MATAKKYLLAVRKDIYEGIVAGAAKSGLSIAEFTDKLMRSDPTGQWAAALEDNLRKAGVPNPMPEGYESSGLDWAPWMIKKIGEPSILRDGSPLSDRIKGVRKPK